MPIDDRGAVERDEAVCGVSDRGDAQRVAFRVGVVGEQLLGLDRYRFGLLDGERVRHADGGIIDPG